MHNINECYYIQLDNLSPSVIMEILPITNNDYEKTYMRVWE
jgi:hypothetical protein